MNTPDGIELLKNCLRTLGVRCGEIPDGIVLEGAKHHDGFDLDELLPAHVSGAFAVAGLKCMGQTTVRDDLLVERLPDLGEILEKLSSKTASSDKHQGGKL